MTLTSTTHLIDKYNHYRTLGHSVLSVTLSTYVKSDQFAASDVMRKFWDHHFIYRVKQCMPFKARTKIDHDWVLEESPKGFYHYHGLTGGRFRLCTPHLVADGLEQEAQLGIG